MSRYMRWRDRAKVWLAKCGLMHANSIVAPLRDPIPEYQWTKRETWSPADFGVTGNPYRMDCDEVPPTKEQPMKAGKFQVFRGNDGQWYWRLRSNNGRIVAASEGYTREYDAKRSCQAVMTAARGARIVE